MTRSRRWTLSAAVVLAALAVSGQDWGPSKRAAAEAETTQASQSAPVVVELFTSQGCSSCPPADALLGELAQIPGILALSMHVDYWDYIGWKDPYASPKVTERQRRYAQRLGLRYVYTPQMVIDGHADVVGVRRNEVLRTIEEAAAKRKAVEVRFEQADGGRIVVPAGHAPDGGAVVWLAVYDDNHETDIGSGENAGRKLRYHNVVRELNRIALWHGDRLEIPFDMAAAAAQGRDGCAVIVQQAGGGPVLGAAAMPLEVLRQ
jgi:hypothetical protein